MLISSTYFISWKLMFLKCSHCVKSAWTDEEQMFADDIFDQINAQKRLEVAEGINNIDICFVET